MVFHRSVKDSKFPQVSETLLSILADINIAVVWMISTRPLFSISSISVPNTPITIDITLIFIFCPSSNEV